MDTLSHQTKKTAFSRWIAVTFQKTISIISQNFLFVSLIFFHHSHSQQWSHLTQTSDETNKIFTDDWKVRKISKYCVCDNSHLKFLSCSLVVLMALCYNALLLLYNLNLLLYYTIQLLIHIILNIHFVIYDLWRNCLLESCCIVCT